MMTFNRSLPFMKLKILTFNWHEPYLCLLSKLGHEFLVVEPEIKPGNIRKWNLGMRPVPNNFELISIAQAHEKLEEGEIDCVIAHNVKDLIEVKSYFLPKINVFHNCLTTEIKLGKDKVDRDDYLDKLIPLLDGVTKVFISEMKRVDWGMEGNIILPGFDISEYGGYTGENKSVLRVGNLLKERDLMMGYSICEQIIGTHPIITLGMNPDISGSRISNDFEDLLTQFRKNRVYINSTVDGYEDGYNMAMLEAMATGMPVVACSNKSTPIIDGVNGFCSDDPSYLNLCIDLLMKDQNLAERLGNNAQQTVAEKFPLGQFINSWSRVIESTIKDFLQSTGITMDKELTCWNDELNSNNKPENYYRNIRHDLIPLIPDDANCILEVGCAEGLTGNELKKKKGVFVAGIEFNQNAAEKARKVLDDVITGDVESMDLPYATSFFDCVIFADVLEHLVNPLDALKNVNKVLKDNGSVVLSIPNVQFFGVVNNLVEGNWTYQKEGILDETHLRFFTFKEIKKLIENAGLYIERIEETLDPQYENFSNGKHTSLKFGRISIDNLTPAEIRPFFVFQYKLIARKVNVVRELPNKNSNEETDSMEKLLTEANKKFDEDEYESALTKYEVVIAINSSSAEAHAGAGNCYMRLQKPDKAEDSFVKAKTHDPNNYKAWLGLGILEIYRKNFKQAEMNINKSLEINPNSDKALCALGIIKAENSEYPESEAYYCRALNINIENLLAIKSLAELSYKTESFESIYKYLKQYLDIHSSSVNMLFVMAGIQFKKGMIEDSLRTLDDVLSIDPDHKLALDFKNNVLSVSI